MARQYTDANQIEIRYRWRHNGHSPPSPLECLIKRDDAGRREWLELRVGQLYTTEPFMELSRYKAEEFAAFEQSAMNMNSLPEIYRLLRIKPSQIVELMRAQVMHSAELPDNSARKMQLWQELFAEYNSTVNLLYQKNGYLEDVSLTALWEHLGVVKAYNRRLREILFPQGRPPQPQPAQMPQQQLQSQQQQQQDPNLLQIMPIPRMPPPPQESFGPQVLYPHGFAPAQVLASPQRPS